MSIEIWYEHDARLRKPEGESSRRVPPTVGRADANIEGLAAGSNLIFCRLATMSATFVRTRVDFVGRSPGAARFRRERSRRRRRRVGGRT